MSFLKRNLGQEEPVSANIRVCPEGYTIILGRTQRPFRMNGKLKTDLEGEFYVPEYYNQLDCEKVFEDLYNKKSPLSSFKTENQKRMRKSYSLEVLYPNANCIPNSKLCSEYGNGGLFFSIFVSDEHEGIMKNYREEKGIEWNDPLTEPLVIKEYGDVYQEFVDGGGSFPNQDKEVA